jgi:DNA (cytosine-5)-methyltransferase 1
MNVLSLFSGIGGLELGLERAGMTVVGQVEIDPFCRQVLAKHWPEVPRHDDVRTCVEWWRSEPRPAVHLVAGGFPCQPSSTAGPRLGAGDERWLWPAMADVIEALRPAWVVWENVPGLRTRGLGAVLHDLDRLGYACRVGTLSACEVGAPHPRERLFGVAHAEGRGCRPRRRAGPAAEALESGGRRAEPHRPWSAEPDVARVAYGRPSGVDRRRALGNAVVPQVAEHVGRLVMAAAS